MVIYSCILIFAYVAVTAFFTGQQSSVSDEPVTAAAQVIGICTLFFAPLVPFIGRTLGAF